MSYSFFLNSALSLIMYSLNISNSFYNDSVREVVRREVVTIGDALLLRRCEVYGKALPKWITLGVAFPRRIGVGVLLLGLLIILLAVILTSKSKFRKLYYFLSIFIFLCNNLKLKWDVEIESWFCLTWWRVIANLFTYPRWVFGTKSISRLFGRTGIQHSANWLISCNWSI